MSSYDHIKVCYVEDVNAGIINSFCESIIVPTNTIGVLNYGLGKICRQDYRDSYTMYLRYCELKQHRPESPILYLQAGIRHNILYCAIKERDKGPPQLEYVEANLKWLVENKGYYSMMKSIALPPLGCEYRGLNWYKDIRPLYIEYLPKIKLPITLYLPKAREV